MFDRIKKVLTPLYASKPIRTEEQRRDTSIQSGAESVQQAEQLGVQEAEDKGSAARSMANNLVQGASLAVRAKEQYNSNVRSDTIMLSSSVHKNAMDGIKNSIDPDEINSIASSASSTLDGMSSSLSFVPEREKAALSMALGNYSSSIRQVATNRATTIGYDNSWKKASISSAPLLTSMATSFINAKTDEERNEVIGQLHAYSQQIEEMPVLTTGQDKEKAGIQSRIQQAIKVATDPYGETPKPNTQFFNELTLDQYHRKTDVKNTVQKAWYTNEDPRVIGMGAMSSQQPYIDENARIAKETQLYRSALSSSHDIKSTMSNFSASGNPVISHVNTLVNNLLDTGRADVLAQSIDPQIRSLAVKMGAMPIGSVQRQQAQGNLVHAEKVFVLTHNLPIDSLQTLPDGANDKVDEISNRDPELNSSHLSTLTGLLNTVVPRKGGYMPDSTPQSDALRVLSLQETRDGASGTKKFSFPQSALQMSQSYSPSVQEDIKSSQEFIKDPKSFGKYENAAGKKEFISNMRTLKTSIYQNSSDFPVEQMQAYGFKAERVVNAMATQVIMRVQNGMSPEDSMEGVSKDYQQMVRDTPSYGGKYSGIHLMAPKSALDNYAGADMTEDDKTEALAATVKHQFRLNREAVKVSTLSTGKESPLVDEQQTRDAIDTHLGDGKDLRVFARGGVLMVTNSSGTFFQTVNPEVYAREARKYEHKNHATRTRNSDAPESLIKTYPNLRAYDEERGRLSPKEGLRTIIGGGV